MRGEVSGAIDIRYIPTALICWGSVLIIMLPFAALGAHLGMCGEKMLAYISSALSFVSAVFAGLGAMSVRGRHAVQSALVVAMCIVIISLTLGFVIAGKALQPDAILSIASFSLAGTLVGAVFAPKKKGKSSTGHKLKLKR